MTSLPSFAIELDRPGVKPRLLYAMHRISLRFAPILIALLMSFSLVSFASAAVAPAPSPDLHIANQDHDDEDGEAANGEEEGEPLISPAGTRSTSIKEVVLWSTAALSATLIVLTALYMLKRRVGGFPENPDWVAPIQVLYSKDSPDEGYFGDVDPNAAHGAHGSH